jgi:hypothetical protein
LAKTKFHVFSTLPGSTISFYFTVDRDILNWGPGGEVVACSGTSLAMLAMVHDHCDRLTISCQYKVSTVAFLPIASSQLLIVD